MVGCPPLAGVRCERHVGTRIQAVWLAKSVAEVVEKGLCTGCGAVSEPGWPERLRMDISPQGFMRPRTTEALRETSSCASSRFVLVGSSWAANPARRVASIIGFSVIFAIWRRARLRCRNPTQSRHWRRAERVGLPIWWRAVESMVYCKSGYPETTASHEAYFNSRREDIMPAAGSRYGPAGSAGRHPRSAR